MGKSDRDMYLSMKMGADRTIDLRVSSPSSFAGNFDILYDATGSPEGLSSAITMSRREVHLKSTHGMEFFGIKHLTELVVDELSILPFSQENLKSVWKNEKRKNKLIYLSDEDDISRISSEYIPFKGNHKLAEEYLLSERGKSMFPRFDIGIASNISEIDSLIRPNNFNENSLIRPRGAILFHGYSAGNPLLEFISGGKSLKTSRCGNFNKAIALLGANPNIARAIGKYLITHIFKANELPLAFKKAREKAQSRLS